VGDTIGDQNEISGQLVGHTTWPSGP
jgi:hypothetical protein